MKFLIPIILFLIFTIGLNAQKPDFVISAPAGSSFTQIIKDGKTIIPNGRILTPTGKSFLVAPHPYGLALSNDGNIAVTANSGTNPISITILRNLNSGNPEIQ